MNADSQTHVLVVEDDFAMRRLFERFLTGLGYHVHAVASAGAALDVLRADEIHAIVSDHHLGGGMDGVQLLELCKRSFPNLPRILVTAADDFDIATRAVNEGGITALVRKPWAGPELAAALAEARPSTTTSTPSYQSASNTIPQFTALTRTTEAPVVSWDEVDSVESQRVLDANRDVESLQRLFGSALSL